MQFNLDLAYNTILSCFIFFFLIIDLHFLIPAAMSQIFNSIAELVVPLGMSIKEVKEEIEIYLVIVEAKTRKFSI